MASHLNPVRGVSIDIVDSKDLPPENLNYPKVNVYIDERMKNVHSLISPVREYNSREKKWTTNNHIISDPIIGKEILKNFRYGNGEQNKLYADEEGKQRYTKAVGEKTILTVNSKEIHAKIHKNYHTYFSTIYKNEDFNERLKKNIEIYLERFINVATPITLNTLAGELVTVVIQNTVNGYSQDISEPSYWVEKILTPDKGRLKSVEEIDAHLGKPQNSWFSGPLSFVVKLVNPIFKNFAIDRHAKNIYDNGAKLEGTFPKYLKDQGNTEE